MYKTEDKDYTGCHPVIAEHLKQGKNIWCKCWDKGWETPHEYLITEYSGGYYINQYVEKGAGRNYIFKHAEPIEVTQRVKEFWPLMEQLKAEGYSLEDDRLTCSDGSMDFNLEMFQFCGKDPSNNEYSWKDSWLEEA